MHRILLALPLLATTVSFAQAPVPPLAHPYPLGEPRVHSLNGWNCPVGMTAEQEATGATQWVVSLEDSGKSTRMPTGKMGVRVALTSPATWAFRDARVVVSYQISPKGAMLLGGTPTTETRTFDLSTGEDPAAQLERSLLLDAGVSVTRVKLLSLTYADGTVWHPSANYDCSVRVSHLLPVAAAQ